jgi:glyoxylase-like metal-dependent hydrolase (beta-lactamase superfamily II)
MSAIKPHNVKLMVLTHGHWDHIGSAREIKEMTGAVIAMHCSETHWLENSLTPLPPGITLWGRIFMALHKIFLPIIKVPPAQVEIAFGNEGLSLEDFGIPGRVIHTPGHSPGSSTVLLDTGEAFVGDLAMNKFPLRTSPGLPIFAEDLDVVVASWKRLIELGASVVYPAHGAPFPVTIIKKKLSILSCE